VTKVAARALFALALALGVATRAYNLAAPFGYGFDGWLGAMHASAARHLARDGFFRLRLLPYLAPGPLAPGDLMPHVHHPPLLHVLEGLAVRALGVHEWALRLVPAAFYLASIALVFALARRLAGPLAGGLAALVFAALPMTGVHGGLVNYEPLVLAGTLAAYVLYLRWREEGHPRDLAAMLAAIALAVLVDWFGAFVVAPIALHALLARPRAPRTALAAGLAAAAVTGAVLAYYEACAPGALREILHQAQHRTSAAAADVGAQAFSAAAWCSRQGRHLEKLFGLLPLGLAALGLAAGAAAGGALRRAAGHAALFGLVGLQALVLFPQASYTHEFLGYPLAPPVAIGVALLAPVLAAPGARPACRAAGAAAYALALAAALSSAQRATWSYLAAFHEDSAYERLGRAVARAVPFEWAFATPGDELNVWICAGFYADRSFETGATTLPAIEAFHRRRAAPGGRPPVRYVVFTPPLYRRHEALARALAARYPHAAGADLLVFDLGPP
jgi:4-amino-4-deoxy-L-arabinose transferase-like glycosyltransferase